MRDIYTIDVDIDIEFSYKKTYRVTGRISGTFPGSRMLSDIVEDRQGVQSAIDNQPVGDSAECSAYIKCQQQTAGLPMILPSGFERHIWQSRKGGPRWVGREELIAGLHCCFITLCTLSETLTGMTNAEGYDFLVTKFNCCSTTHRRFAVTARTFD